MRQHPAQCSDLASRSLGVSLDIEPRQVEQCAMKILTLVLLMVLRIDSLKRRVFISIVKRLGLGLGLGLGMGMGMGRGMGMGMGMGMVMRMGMGMRMRMGMGLGLGMGMGMGL